MSRLGAIGLLLASVAASHAGQTRASSGASASAARPVSSLSPGSAASAPGNGSDRAFGENLGSTGRNELSAPRPLNRAQAIGSAGASAPAPVPGLESLNKPLGPETATMGEPQNQPLDQARRTANQLGKAGVPAEGILTARFDGALTRAGLSVEAPQEKPSTPPGSGLDRYRNPGDADGAGSDGILPPAPSHGGAGKGEPGPARRLRELLVSHFLGVFNDTALRILFSVWVTARLPKQESATYVSLASALFVLPYILFSLWAGRAADRFEKRKIILALKFAEAAIVLAAIAALALGSLHAVLACVFLMGTHTAFLSPAKYGMLPEQVRLDELPHSNGIVELGTVLGLLFGATAGALLAGTLASGVALAAAVFLAAATGGILAARRIPRARFAPPPALAQTGKLRLEKGMRLVMGGIALFWLLSTILQMNTMLYVEHTLKAGETALAALLATMGVGMGIGAYAAGKLSRGKLELGLVALGALGATVCLADLALFGGASLARTFVDMALANVFAGLFIIPLDAYVQRMSQEGLRGRTLGVSNIVTFSSILASSGLFFVLSAALGLSPPSVFLACALVAACGSAGVVYALREDLTRFLGSFARRSS